jgi:hypothetical protein
MTSLQGKWSLVTGASRGVGTHVSEGLAQLGSNLILHSRELAHTQALAAKLKGTGVKVVAVAGELSDQAQVDGLLAAALKQAEEAKLAKALGSYNEYRAKCGREKKRPSVADFMREHPPSRYPIVWTDHEGKAKRTAPTERFLRALRTQLDAIEQADLRTDLYFNNPLAALAAEQQAKSSTNKKRRALDVGDIIDRQLAMRPQKQKQQTRAAEEEEVDNEAEKEEASSFFYLREKEAANTQHYPVYIVTPSWDKDDERAQKAKGNRLLNPTYDEAHAAEPNDCPQMTWEAVVFRFAKPSEIGKDKLYDPFVRPIALVAGGRLTVHLRRYKGSHAEKGLIRVSPTGAWATTRARPSSRPACASGGTPCTRATGAQRPSATWTRAPATTPSSSRPRARPLRASTRSTPRSAIGSSRRRTSRRSLAPPLAAVRVERFLWRIARMD